jgi:hypothetical protein
VANPTLVWTTRAAAGDQLMQHPSEGRGRRRIKRLSILLAALVGLLGLPALPALGDTPPPGDAEPVALIVKLAAGLSPAQQAAVINRDGGTETSAVAALRLHIVAVDPAEADQVAATYASDPQVVRVERDQQRAAEGAATDPAYSSQWALPQIGWDQVHGVVAPGGHATIAVLDTGVDANVPDLAGRVQPGWSAFEAATPSRTRTATGRGSRRSRPRPRTTTRASPVSRTTAWTSCPSRCSPP